MSMTIPKGTKAMIFAAGLGTRLKPFTDKHPKALAPVNGKPLLQRNIEYFAAAGIRDIIINVHHFADQVINFLHVNNNFGCNIVISHEIEEPLETGGGLKKAAWFFEASDLPFFVMNADILTNLDLEQFYAYHLQKKDSPHSLLPTGNRPAVSFLTRTNCYAGGKTTRPEKKEFHGNILYFIRPPLPAYMSSNR